MELYEANYMLLRRLIPDVRHIEDRAISRVEGCMDLHVEVTERCRYTTMLRMTYDFGQDADPRLLPDLQVRLYHDARTAEAISRVVHDRQSHRLITRPATSLQARWELNRFLQRWLGFCLNRGHRIAAPDRQPALT